MTRVNAEAAWLFQNFFLFYTWLHLGKLDIDIMSSSNVPNMIVQTEGHHVLAEFRSTTTIKSVVLKQQSGSASTRPSLSAFQTLKRIPLQT